MRKKCTLRNVDYSCTIFMTLQTYFAKNLVMHMCSMFVNLWSLARIALLFVFLARCVGTRRNCAVFFFCGSYFDIIILTKTLFLLLGEIIQNLLTQ